MLSRGIIFIDLAIAQIAGLRGDARRPVGIDDAATASRCAAAALGGALTLTDRATGPMSGAVDRHRVRARRHRQRAVAGEQRPRRRTPERPPRRPDPVGSASRLPRPYSRRSWCSGSARERFGRAGSTDCSRSRSRLGATRRRVSGVRDADRAPAGDRGNARHRLTAAWGLGALGYAAGLLLSMAWDLPSGPAIVWTLAALALGWYGVTARTAIQRPSGPR